jgi:putative FmdB family regulatory protein
MPTYDYECRACGHTFEKFQPITSRPIHKCPDCGQRKVRRLIGMGAGVIFKGSGFYQTDYRSASYKKAAEKDKAPGTNKDAGGEKKPSTSGEAKAGSSSSEAEPKAAKED